MNFELLIRVTCCRCIHCFHNLSNFLIFYILVYVIKHQQNKAEIRVSNWAHGSHLSFILYILIMLGAQVMENRILQYMFLLVLQICCSWQRLVGSAWLKSSISRCL